MANRFQRRRFLKDFFNIWAWPPSWLYDQDHLYKEIQFQGITYALKDYARTHNILHFTKKLKLPFIPINIFSLIKSKKGGKDFYIILNRNND